MPLSSFIHFVCGTQHFALFVFQLGSHSVTHDVCPESHYVARLTSALQQPSCIRLPRARITDVTHISRFHSALIVNLQSSHCP